MEQIWKTADFLNGILKFCYYVVIRHRAYKYLEIPGPYLYPNIVANSRRHDELQLFLHFCFDLGKRNSHEKLLTLLLARACLLSDAAILRHRAAKLHTKMRKHNSFPLCPPETPDFKTVLSSEHFHLQLIKYIKIRSCGSSVMYMYY